MNATQQAQAKLQEVKAALRKAVSNYPTQPALRKGAAEDARDAKRRKRPKSPSSGSGLAGLGARPSQDVRTPRARARADATRSPLGLVKTSVPMLKGGFSDHPTDSLKREVSMPITVGHVIESSVGDMPAASTTTKNGHVRFTGTEYIGRMSLVGKTGATASLPAGGCLLQIPLNPIMWDGARIKQMSQLYEQFKIVRMSFEYLSACPTTAPGMLVGFSTSDTSDNPTTYYGDACLRAAYSRAGSMGFPVWQSARFDVNATLFEWYYTRGASYDPSASQPGTFYLLSGSDFQVQSGGDPIQFGTIRAHYEIDFKLPSIEDPSDFEFNATTLTVTPLPTTAGTVIEFTGGSFPAQYRNGGVIVSAPITIVSDPASNDWNQLDDPTRGRRFSLLPGAQVFFRNDVTQGRFHAYASFADAMVGDEPLRATRTIGSFTTEGLILGVARGYTV